jgi:ABC-type Fe3+-hydroxamate transport system substrate-binding protein
VRPNAGLQLAALFTTLLCAACASKSSSDASNQTLAPLRACELRAITVDGTDLLIDTNADASLASVTVVRAPNDTARVQALDDVLRHFGPARRDTRTFQRQARLGLSTVTDACGRPVTPNSPAAGS